MATTGTVTYTATSIPGTGEKVYNLSSAYGTNMKIDDDSSVFPSVGYSITSAVVNWSVRSYSGYTNSVNVFLGATNADVSDCVKMTSSAKTFSTGKAKLDTTGFTYGNRFRLYLVGNGGTAGTLNAVAFTMTVTWQQTTSACTAPTTLTVDPTLTNNTATLSWSGAASGTNNTISSYLIQYRDYSSSVWGDWTNLKTVTSTATSGSTSVSPNSDPTVIRQFRIQARGTGGSTYYSDYKTTSSPHLRLNVAPTDPSNVTATPAIYESGGITVSWSKSTSSYSTIASYSVYIQTRDSSSGSWSSSSLAGTATSTTYTHSPSLSRGAQIRYLIRATDATGATSGLISSDPVQKNQAPSTPETLTASCGALWESGAITLTWAASQDGDSNLDHYLITCSSGTTWTATKTLTELSVTAPDVSRGATFYYSIKAVDELGVSSGSTKCSTITRNALPSVPGTPSISTEIWESGSVKIAWTASTDEGSVTYKIRSRIDSGSWGDPVAVSTNSYTFAPSTTGFDRGSVMTFQVQAVDALSAVSSWSAESAGMTRNSVPGAAQITRPTADQTSLRPTFTASVSAEPDEQTMTVQYSADGGTWTSTGTLPYTGGTVTWHPGTLTAGPHTISVRVVDSLGGIGAETAKTITAAGKTWSREIASGDTIANTEISHQADITELQSVVNEIRANYGLGAISMPEIGLFSTWYSCMTALYNGLVDCYKIAGLTPPTITDQYNGYPQAAVINTVRDMCEEV